jgi:DNA-nicking Smr family endonuclease
MDGEPDAEVDLHSLSPEMALRRLARELHACRLRRMETLLVITGRGWGNREQIPILRPKVEEWLRGSEGKRFGVVGFETTSRGGALLVRLRRGSES